MPVNRETGMVEAAVPVVAAVDAKDIIRGLDNSDPNILAFVIQLLEAADSIDLREDLAVRLSTWNEDRS